jgi:hypothetical protein
MLEMSCLMAYTSPVTELAEKKNAIRKKLSRNKGFQLYR